MNVAYAPCASGSWQITALEAVRRLPPKLGMAGFSGREDSCPCWGRMLVSRIVGGPTGNILGLIPFDCWWVPPKAFGQTMGYWAFYPMGGDISTEEVKDLVFSPEKETSKPLGLGAVSKERVELGPSLPLLSIPFVSADLSNGEIEMGSDSVLAKNGVASDEVSSSSGEEEGKTGSSSGEVEVEGNPEDPPSIGLVSVSGGDKDVLNQEEAELVDVDAVGDVGSGDFFECKDL
ncbi:hypothetical protein U1Q18_032672 [Sarracenia purpurea var. burkii]